MCSKLVSLDGYVSFEDQYLYQDFNALLAFCNAIWGTSGGSTTCFLSPEVEEQLRDHLWPKKVRCRKIWLLPDVQEVIPPNATKPLGNGMILRMFMKSEYTGDKASQCSRTGLWSSSTIEWSICFDKAVNCWDLIVWSQIFHNEKCHFELAWHMLEAWYAGHPYPGCIICVQW